VSARVFGNPVLMNELQIQLIGLGRCFICRSKLRKPQEVPGFGFWRQCSECKAIFVGDLHTERKERP